MKKEKEKISEEGPRNRDLLVCTLRNPKRNTKVEGITYKQKTRCRSMQAMCKIPQSL